MISIIMMRWGAQVNQLGSWLPVARSVSQMPALPAYARPASTPTVMRTAAARLVRCTSAATQHAWGGGGGGGGAWGVQMRHDAFLPARARHA